MLRNHLIYKANTLPNHFNGILQLFIPKFWLIANQIHRISRQNNPDFRRLLSLEPQFQKVVSLGALARFTDSADSGEQLRSRPLQLLPASLYVECRNRGKQAKQR
jgi:hypothetical protein